ncbi:TPA: regulatory protein ToxS [Vibrio vulnificus]|nr:regulatory protein ToxS [Vibrio vulnificus]HDY8209407.1 regulatory protein ToxS [Vibrio vulnificus]
MKLRIASGVLAASAIFSSWLYWGSDLKVEQVLTSKEWQSYMVTVINDELLSDGSVGPLRKATLTSNVKYLPNGNYVRVSALKLYSNESSQEVIINISESGSWDVNDNYLLVNAKEFKDISSSQSKDFTDAQLKLITKVFKMDAQQSRRIDIVNDKTLLLTSLNHGSSVLFTN